MRRSTSRIASRYSTSFVAIALRPSAPCRCATSSLTESSTLRCWRMPRQPRPSDRCCRCRRTAARTRRAGCSPSAAACSALRQRDRVRVGAGEAGVARARRLAGLDRQLERRQLRLLARLLREDLIHRDAGVEPGLARRRRDVGEEARARLRVRAARPSRRRARTRARSARAAARGTARARSASA